MIGLAKEQNPKGNNTGRKVKRPALLYLKEIYMQLLKNAALFITGVILAIIVVIIRFFDKDYDTWRK
jgi:hypothetical protein